jgi:AhpD family alkylhydroperoxidase
MRTKLGRRTYRNFKEFLADMWFLLRNTPQILRMLRRGTVSPAFRERLMLAVTAVYRCRYCTWVHTKEALRSGLTKEDVTTLLSGSVNDCPNGEAIAILYAQHWADAEAKPTPESFKMLVDSYGREKAQAVNLVLRMIRIGNLTGNSWDNLLHRVSFGKLGT